MKLDYEKLAAQLLEDTNLPIEVEEMVTKIVAQSIRLGYREGVKQALYEIDKATSAAMDFITNS